MEARETSKYLQRRLNIYIYIRTLVKMTLTSRVTGFLDSAYPCVKKGIGAANVVSGPSHVPSRLDLPLSSFK